MHALRTARRLILLTLPAILLPGVTPPAVSGAEPDRQAAAAITVAAGEHDRRDTPVAFDLPATPIGGEWELRDEAGGVTPVQTDGGARATFILKDLKSGQTRTYHLQRRAAPAAAAPAASATRDGGAVKIAVGGKEVLAYQAEKVPAPESFGPAYTRGGYISPVYTPGGKLVTDDYPPNHKHHHGIWAPWTKTEFEGRHPDFWNMGDKTGTVEPVSLDATWSGPVFAGVKARHRFVDLSAKPQPKVALNEQWEVRVYNVGQYRVVDWQSTQTCATDSPLVLPKYYYGGLGFRGNRQWNGAGDKCRFLTSEGKTRADGNETRARWCRISGDVDGQPASIAILCHPDNFRFPQPVRLHPTEPFFCYAPSQLGDWRIEPGKPYVARYRFVVADGEPDKAEIDRLWNDYAKPPTVK